MDAADQIIRYVDRAAFAIAGVAGIDDDIYANIIGRRDIPVLVDRTAELINGADLVVTSSGTATIETAYFMTPMVVIYKTGLVTYQIAKRVIRLRSIGMVNIVAGREVVPELIQGRARGRTIAREAIAILRDKERYEAMVTDLSEVRDALGKGNAARQAVDAIMEVEPLC
jgi:lipid-A-disaccharide synthase